VALVSAFAAMAAPASGQEPGFGQEGGGPAGGAALVEPDERWVPWDAVRRLTLEGGVPLPPYRPLSRQELLEALRSAWEDGAPALRQGGESALLERLVRQLDASGAGLSASLRSGLLFGEVGYVVEGQAGLAAAPGLEAVIEPSLAGGSGRWWGAVTARIHGRALRSGRVPADPFLYAGWPDATGAPRLRDARLASGAWAVDWPLAVAGARLGNWAVSAGWAPARTGPGVGGGLLLGETGPPLPSITLRRTAPFRWSGPLGPLAPASLLVRVGRVSAQQIVARDGWRSRSWRDEPWLTQWLLGWRPARWLSAGGSLAALSVARSGSLLPDLLQVNFPLPSVTSVEAERGPVTDRIASLQFEGRWRRAPWPLLPAAAGRLYWEYGGEDLNPPGRIPLLPQLSAPASILGVELVDPRWDLSLEYTELEHPLVLWYGNGGLSAGWTQRGWLLGHPLGGSGEGVRGATRWRPAGALLEIGLLGSHATCGQAGMTPGRSERWTWELSLQPPEGAARWRIAVAHERELVSTFGSADGGAPQRLDWWRAEITGGF